MSINERVRAIIEVHYGGNKRLFATTLGVAPTVIENVVGARRGKPSYDVLVKMCENAHISPSWLLTGEGEMLMERETPAVASVGDNSPGSAAGYNATANTDLSALLARVLDEVAAQRRLTEEALRQNAELIALLRAHER